MYDWMGSNNKAIGFLRVSSHRQKDNTSHEVQEKEVTEYCQNHGLKLVKVVRIVESAKDSDTRKKYRKAKDDAIAEGIRHHVYYMGDREARNLTDNEENEKDVLRDVIVLHYARDRKVLHRDSADSDFFVRDINAVAAKNLSRVIRAKVVDAALKKAEDGWFPGNKPPLGYMHQHKKDEFGNTLKRGTIIVPDQDPTKVSQVQREFELRGIERMTLEQIRKQIVAEGFISPSQVSQYRINTIERRLKNPFYDSKFNWNGQVYPANHERIVSQRLFNLVQETFGNKGLRVSKSGIFSGGWLRCAECDCAAVYDPKTKHIKSTDETKTYHDYRCSNSKRVHKKLQNVIENKIWDGLANALDEISISKSFAEKVADALNEAQQRARVATVREAEKYQNELKALEAKEDHAYDSLQNRVIDDRAYKRVIERIRDERQFISQQLTQVNLKINDAVIETAQSVIELCIDARSLWKERSEGERLEFLDDILSNRWLDGSSVRYELKKPFQVMSEMRESKDWRSRREENPVG